MSSKTSELHGGGRVACELTFDRPSNIPTSPELRRYIVDALESCGGSRHPHDPLFHSLANVVVGPFAKVAGPGECRLEPLHAVLVMGRGAKSGRIGMTVEAVGDRTWRVQFGSGGPFSRIKESSLRYATEQEVAGAGLLGTGFKIWESEQDQRKGESRT